LTTSRPPFAVLFFGSHRSNHRSQAVAFVSCLLPFFGVRSRLIDCVSAPICSSFFFFCTRSIQQSIASGSLCFLSSPFFGGGRSQPIDRVLAPLCCSFFFFARAINPMIDRKRQPLFPVFSLFWGEIIWPIDHVSAPLCCSFFVSDRSNNRSQAVAFVSCLLPFFRERSWLIDRVSAPLCCSFFFFLRVSDGTIDRS